MSGFSNSSRGNRRSGSGSKRPAKSGGSRSGGGDVKELTLTVDAPDIESFTEWDLDAETLGAIAAMDITVPTPIQRLAIGPVLEGKDVIAKAETGTGKTLAFGAPMMSRIDPARSSVLGLVLCPTRELAQQVAQVLEALALPRGVGVALVVGGDPMQPQVSALQAGAQVVVGTPGRVLDLYNQRFLSFPWTEFVVLDEADKMFEIGFQDEVRKILDFTPEERQTLLFSATFPTDVLKMARSHTREPVEIATAQGTNTVESIEQYFVEVEHEDDRLQVLKNVLRGSEKSDTFLVFCDRRTDVDRLLRRFERSPYETKALHGGYDQASRFRVMSAFRTGDVKVLIATDVASRGLDVNHVTHVINFGVPRELEDYAHRVGRTGRAGRTGTAITLVAPIDRRRWSSLHRQAKWGIYEMDISGHPLEAPPKSERADEREASEEPPRRERGRERSEEREPSEDRPRRGRGRERSERTDARVATEERPDQGREQEDGERGRRPRRRARNGGERGEQSAAPRREDSDRKTPSRGERDREQPRQDKEERAPRREESARGEDRESRPRRSRRRRNGERQEERGSREERPADQSSTQERRTERPSPPPPPVNDGGFGAGI